MNTETHTLESISALVNDWLRGLETVEVPARPDVLLTDLGLDSLSIVDFSQMLRREIGVEIKAAEFDLYGTLAETVAAIHERARAA